MHLLYIAISIFFAFVCVGTIKKYLKSKNNLELMEIIGSALVVIGGILITVL